uniref:RRM domain-containing protein n=1 Tax=Cryptomonas curvata TaxID=233186 RepID=A0A7S0N9G7_9CRYP|mmetsp:Transcript_7614/g.16349  ORF Transcript_7614/g.16349 Transcript_7614/m.16349 type:complete len:133 (+) Transcript_7614:37-435(+)
MAAVRLAAVCVACLGVASAFMIPSAGFGLRAALPSAALRQSSTSKISMQALDELKLFVGGLPWAMESEELKQAFSEFGAVQDANIVYDRETGRSRGFGFVTFTEKAHAEAACNQMNQAVSRHTMGAAYLCCD